MDEAICLYLAGEKNILKFEGGIRLWTNPFSVILGRTCKTNTNLQIPVEHPLLISSKKSVWNHRVLLCRRLSGGGTVLHGPGNINYSIFLSLERFPEMFSVKHSYKVLLEAVSSSLEVQGLKCKVEGDSDIAVCSQNIHSQGNSEGNSKEEKLHKISGNAQFRKKGILVLHGTLITSSKFSAKVETYLAHPAREPDYRKGRTHRDFIRHLPDFFDLSVFRTCLTTHLEKFFGIRKMVPFPMDDRRYIYSTTRSLVQNQYANEGWIMEGKRVNSTPN